MAKDVVNYITCSSEITSNNRCATNEDISSRILLSSKKAMKTSLVSHRVMGSSSMSNSSKATVTLITLNYVSFACHRRTTAPPPSDISKLFNRLESRSLLKLIRQMAPPTKNGHTLPPNKKCSG